MKNIMNILIPYVDQLRKFIFMWTCPIVKKKSNVFFSLRETPKYGKDLFT